VLEVNPRASRTVPFVSKAIGAPVAKIAAKVMAGVSLAEQLNSTTDIAAGGARLRLTPFTSIVALAEVQRDRFESSPEKDADSLRIAPYVEFDNGAAVVGRARAGYRAFRPVHSSVAGYDGPVASVTLGLRVLDRLRGRLDGGRDVRFSYDPFQPFYLETGLLFEIRYRVAGPFELIGMGERWQLRHQRIGGASFDGRRENTSMTNATYTNPRHVGTYVRSATHSWFGRTAVNFRVTRSGGRPAAASGIVVTVNLRPRTAPARPRRRIRRPTVQRATACPSRRSCFQTLRTP